MPNNGGSKALSMLHRRACCYASVAWEEVTRYRPKLLCSVPAVAGNAASLAGGSNGLGQVTTAPK